MFAMQRLGATTLFVGVLVSLATPANATLTTCQNVMVDAKGRGATMKIAFDKATFNWHIAAEDMFGMYFGDWGNAHDRDRDCYTSGALAYCNVQARPCMEGSDYPGGVNKNPVYE
jgi:hypothetical protein